MKKILQLKFPKNLEIPHLEIWAKNNLEKSGFLEKSEKTYNLKNLHEKLKNFDQIREKSVMYKIY